MFKFLKTKPAPVIGIPCEKWCVVYRVEKKDGEIIEVEPQKTFRTEAQARAYYAKKGLAVVTRVFINVFLGYENGNQ